MLHLNQPNRLTFTMDVLGTAAAPTARVLVGSTPALAYPATKLTGTSWETTIDLPEGTKIGSIPFKVEVMINGRIFHPINTMIEIAAGQKEEVRVIQSEPPAPQELVKQVEAESVTEITEPKKPKAKLLVGLDAVVKTKIPEVKTTKVSMKDVANAHPPSMVKEAAVRETTRTVQSGPPIRLIKGEIIYK